MALWGKYVMGFNKINEVGSPPKLVVISGLE